MKAAVIMGSRSDLPVVEKVWQMLERFGIEYEVRVLSAHRTPDEALAYARAAEENGIDLLIGRPGFLAFYGADAVRRTGSDGGD